MRDKALILIPLFACLFPNPDFNTSPVPFAAEVGRGENGTILPDRFLEHGHEFRRKREHEGLAILDNPCGEVHFFPLKVHP